MESLLTKKQTRIYGPKRYTTTYGNDADILVTVRYDDECGNGHNTFSITADIWERTKGGASRVYTARDIDMGGCCHDDVIKAFPELKPFIKWHLFDSTGPMHYIANTVYHASDKDYWGLRKGEKRHLKNGRTKQPVWEAVTFNGKGEAVKVSGISWKDSDEKPQKDGSIEWVPVWKVGEGKERELDFARSCAVWPEATDTELKSPGLKTMLERRLSDLLADFKKDVESLDFIY